MLGLLLFGVCVGWTIGHPAEGSQGVGAYAYSDSAGNRYGGTYGLRGNDVSKGNQNIPVPFSQFQNPDDFFPDFFRNFQMMLQDAFSANPGNQQIALNAAKKAFDLTSNQASEEPNFFRNPFGGIGRFGSGFGSFGSGFGMPGFRDNFMTAFNAPGRNSAFASGMIGPGFRHQVAAINPVNQAMPNVNIMNRFAEVPPGGVGGKHYSVSSSSYASSSDINGQKLGSRGAETVVNDNGKITKYSVHD